MQEMEDAPPSRRSLLKTFLVMVLVLGASLGFSYLLAYALVNTLAHQNIIAPPSHNADPRFTWMLRIFGVIVVLFCLLTLFFRLSSRRQMSQIDAMTDAED